MNMELVDWDSISDILNRPELITGKMILIDDAIGLMDTEWYQFDPELKKLSYQDKVSMMLEVGILPFSPIEKPTCDATKDLYDWWIDSMYLTPDTLKLEDWKQSPVFNTRHKWRMVSFCQLTSFLLWQIAKIQHPESIPQVVEGHTHTFVICENIIYDLLWYWEPVEKFIEEMQDATFWLDPILYLKEGYEVLSPEQIKILDEYSQ